MKKFVRFTPFRVCSRLICYLTRGSFPTQNWSLHCDAMILDKSLIFSEM